MNWDLAPRQILGQKTSLEPLVQEHFPTLCECLLNEPDGWFSHMYGLNTSSAIQRMIDGWLSANKEGRALSFVARDLLSKNVAGISQFMRVDKKNKQLEIGGTMVGQKFRRTHVNTEMKYLMLREAFESLGAIRVYVKADIENLESQRALIRIKAKYEGTARNDGLLPDGRKRDFQIFGIIDSEWPEVKNHIEGLLK